MLKKFLAVFIVCMMVLTSAFVCGLESAFKDVNIEYDRESGIVSISGELTSDDETLVRLLVLKPETNTDKLIEGAISFVTNGVYAEETVASGGVFTFEDFKLKDSYQVGDYIVRIVAKNEVYEGVVSHATKTQALALLNNSTSVEEIQELISLYNDVYCLDVSEDALFSKIGDEGKTYVLEKICEGTFENVKELQKEFNKQAVLYKIYLGPWGSVENLITENKELLSLELDRFEKLSQSEKDNVCKNIIGTLYSDAEELNEKISDEVDKINAVAKKPTGGSSGGKGGSSGGKQVNLGSSSNSQKEEGKQEEVKEEKTLPFDDLDGYSWALESINFLYEKGIVNGKAEKVFAPGDYVKRAEAVKIIVSALGLENKNATCNFSDVEKSSWMYEFVAAASAKNIANGYGDNIFGANDNITREDLVTMIIRALDVSGIELEATKENAPFDDEEMISDYAKEAVELMHNAGIVNGSDNHFYPKNNASRAELAKIIAGIIK